MISICTWEMKRGDPSFALPDNSRPWGAVGSLDSTPSLWAWGLGVRTLVWEPYLTVQTQAIILWHLPALLRAQAKGNLCVLPRVLSFGSGCSAWPSPAGALGTRGWPASFPAPTSALNPRTFLGVAGCHSLWKPTDSKDLPHLEQNIVVYVLLWPGLLRFPVSILALLGKAGSGGWGLQKQQVVCLLGRLRFPGSASCIPLGPPLALFCLFFFCPSFCTSISPSFPHTTLSSPAHCSSPAPFSLYLSFVPF